MGTKKDFNYEKSIKSFVDGIDSMSQTARHLVDAGATPEELSILEGGIQHLFDEGYIDKRKVSSINSSLQRETKRYSLDVYKKALNVGCKVDEDGEVTVGRVTNTRKRGSNKPKTKPVKQAGKVMTLSDSLDQVAALCKSAKMEDSQKIDVVKMLAKKLKVSL